MLARRKWSDRTKKRTYLQRGETEKKKEREVKKGDDLARGSDRFTEESQKTPFNGMTAKGGRKTEQGTARPYSKRGNWQKRQRWSWMGDGPGKKGETIFPCFDKSDRNHPEQSSPIKTNFLGGEELPYEAPALKKTSGPVGLSRVKSGERKEKKKKNFGRGGNLPGLRNDPPAA